MLNGTIEKEREVVQKSNIHGGAQPVNTQGNASVFKSIIAFLASVIVGVFVVELTLSAAGIGAEEYLKRDPVLGWIPMPGKHIVWRKEGYSNTRVSSAGLVDREHTVTKPSTILRIAAIGDSNTESLQVTREESFCGLLEKQINAQLKDTPVKVEFLNFGVASYSVGQAYLRLKNNASKYSPDIVLLGISVDSPKRLEPNGQGFFEARPYFKAGDGSEPVVDYSEQERWLQSPDGRRVTSVAWLRERSYIWGVISTAAEQIANWTASWKDGNSQGWSSNAFQKAASAISAGTPYAYGIFTAPFRNALPELPHDLNLADRSQLERVWPAYNAILCGIKNECKDLRADLVILRVPCLNGHDNLPESNRLRAFSQDSNSTFVEPKDKVIEYMRSHRTPLFYGVHMTAKTHELIADQLSPVLLQLVKARIASRTQAE